MELPFANMTGMNNTCGDNRDCIFDLGATGRMDVGQMTMEVMNSYHNIELLSLQGKCFNYNATSCTCMYSFNIIVLLYTFSVM